MTCRAAQSGTFPPAAPPRWAPCKGTYQGLFHGTVALHHTAILVNQELPRGGVRRRGPQQLPHAAGQPWSSPPSLKPLPTLVKFHLIALQEKGGVMRNPLATDLAEQIEFDIIAGGEVFDLGISPWLL